MEDEEIGWTVEEWRRWVRQEADVYGLATECLNCFEMFLKQGEHPSIAAHDALYEWDI